MNKSSDLLTVGDRSIDLDSVHGLSERQAFRSIKNFQISKQDCNNIKSCFTLDPPGMIESGDKTENRFSAASTQNHLLH